VLLHALREIREESADRLESFAGGLLEFARSFPKLGAIDGLNCLDDRALFRLEHGELAFGELVAGFDVIEHELDQLLALFTRSCRGLQKGLSGRLTLLGKGGEGDVELSGSRGSRGICIGCNHRKNQICSQNNTYIH
jgi:hypothetical protein